MLKFLVFVNKQIKREIMIYFYPCMQTPPSPELTCASQGFNYMDVKGREQHYPANRLIDAMNETFGIPPSSIPHLLQEKKDIESKLATVDSQVKQLMSQNAALQTQYTALANQKDAEIRILESSNKSQQATHTRLSNELDLAKNEKNKALQETHQLKQDLQTSQTKEVAEKEENQKLKNKLKEQEDEIKALREAMVQQQKQNAELQDKYSREREALKGDYQAKLLENYQRIDKFIDGRVSTHLLSSVSSKTHSSVEETSEEEEAAGIDV